MDGYYNSLLSFIDKAVEEGFISPSARHIIVSAPTAKVLVKKLEVTSCQKSENGNRYREPLVSTHFLTFFLASTLYVLYTRILSSL